MIQVQALEFFYEEKKVLDKITLEIKKDEKVSLLGCNGSGKSTLLRILAGLIFSQKGVYRFEENKITKREIDRAFRKKVGILFQNPESMIFNPTVYDEIAFSLKEFDMDSVDERVLAISKTFGIEKLLKKKSAFSKRRREAKSDAGFYFGI